MTPNDFTAAYVANELDRIIATSRPSAETRTIAVTAIAKALIKAANDFGEGDQIAGDLWVLADAAAKAVEPMLDKRGSESS